MKIKQYFFVSGLKFQVLGLTAKSAKVYAKFTKFFLIKENARKVTETQSSF